MSQSVSRFFTGFEVSLRGARYLMRRRALWRYAALPLFLSTLAAVGLLFGFGHAALDLGARWGAEMSPTWWGTILRVLLYTALTLAVIGSASVSLFALNACLAPFFQSALAERVEKDLGVAPGELPGLPLWREALEAISQAVALLAVNAALLALHLLPGIGSVLSLAVGFYVNSFWLGREALEFPLSLRGWERPRRHRWAKENRAYVLGVGASALAFTWIPLIGSAAYCSSVVGSVLFHRDRRNLR